MLSEVSNMILSSHVAVGMAVVVYSQNPIAGFFAGLVLHHLTDVIPHTDVGSEGANIYNILGEKDKVIKVLIDLAVAIIIFLIAAYELGFSLLLFCCIVGSILPDVIDNSPFWSPALRKIFPLNYYHRFHEKFHFAIAKKEWFWVGHFTQVLVIIFSLYVVIK